MVPGVPAFPKTLFPAPRRYMMRWKPAEAQMARRKMAGTKIGINADGASILGKYCLMGAWPPAPSQRRCCMRPESIYGYCSPYAPESSGAYGWQFRGKLRRSLKFRVNMGWWELASCPPPRAHIVLFAPPIYVEVDPRGAHGIWRKLESGKWGWGGPNCMRVAGRGLWLPVPSTDREHCCFYPKEI